MAKRRIGTLKGKPIVEGDSNLISKNEVNIKELGNTGGGNGAQFPGIYDSDYLFIASVGMDLQEKDRIVYTTVVQALAIVASVGHASLTSNAISFSRCMCSDFIPSAISSYVAYIETNDRYSFSMGLLRISNASLGALRQLYMQAKLSGVSITADWVPKEAFNILTNLDIYEAASLVLKTMKEKGLEVDVYSPEEIKNIVLGVGDNRIIPAAEVEQFLVDIEKG